MPTNELSEALVTARLDALGQLHELGMSLAAVAPPLSFAQWRRRCIDVHEVGSRVDNVVSLVVSSSRRWWIGDELELVTDVAGSIIASMRAIIVGVEPGRDDLPADRLTQIALAFVGAVPDLTAPCQLTRVADHARLEPSR
ncbi:MAG: hypothetical protein NT062_25200 [Proteobacteria bacterium]|nr:hypothetical protein [Pseudomonadota bacterium]